MHLSRNRSLLTRSSLTVAAVAVAVAVAGCTSTTDTVSSTGTSGAAAPGSSAPTTTPPTTDPEPSAPGITDTTAPPTIPASGGDPALIDCGTIYRASGWPTTMLPSRDSFTCLDDAFRAGTPARLVDREQTDGQGGAILVTTYDVLGSGMVRVTVDASEAADRPQGVTVSECAELTAEFVTVTVSGCSIVAS